MSKGGLEDDAVFVAGIDENGLGPKLGPLVVTGALFESEAEDYEPGLFREALGGVAQAGGARVTDSKEVMSTRNMALGETTVLALASLLTGSIPDSVEALLDFVCDPAPPELRSACPPGASGLCFGENEPLPVFGGSLATARAVSSTLEAGMAEAGVRLASVKSEVYCPARYNRWLSGADAPTRPGEGRSKADLDLHAFERRIRFFSEAAGGEGLYLCGKVMNLKYYSPKLASPCSPAPKAARSPSTAFRTWVASVSSWTGTVSIPPWRWRPCSGSTCGSSSCEGSTPTSPPGFPARAR